MTRNWKALVLALTLAALGAGTLAYAGAEGDHEESAKICKARHASGECPMHESGGHGDSE